MSHVKKVNRKSKKQVKTFWTQRNIIIIAVALIAIVAAYFLFFRNKSNEPQFVKEGEVTFISKDTRQKLAEINVEVASNTTERMQGLMYRNKMDDNNGMLFIFEQMEMQSFWMKNTIISLDILFIDSKGVINTIHKSTTPYSEKSLPSKDKSQFVVEVNGGFCERHNIKEGDLIEYKLDGK